MANIYHMQWAIEKKVVSSLLIDRIFKHIV